MREKLEVRIVKNVLIDFLQAHDQKPGARVRFSRRDDNDDNVYVVLCKLGSNNA